MYGLRLWTSDYAESSVTWDVKRYMWRRCQWLWISDRTDVYRRVNWETLDAIGDIGKRHYENILDAGCINVMQSISEMLMPIWLKWEKLMSYKPIWSIDVMNTVHVYGIRPAGVQVFWFVVYLYGVSVNNLVVWVQYYVFYCVLCLQLCVGS